MEKIWVFYLNDFTTSLKLLTKIMYKANWALHCKTCNISILKWYKVYRKDMNNLKMKKTQSYVLLKLQNVNLTTLKTRRQLYHWSSKSIGVGLFCFATNVCMDTIKMLIKKAIYLIKSIKNTKDFTYISSYLTITFLKISLSSCLS